MKVSPVLEGLRVYPFVRLTEAKRRLEADGVPVIDFGIGEPREETPEFIRAALEAEPRSGMHVAGRGRDVHDLDGLRDMAAELTGADADTPTGTPRTRILPARPA